MDDAKNNGKINRIIICLCAAIILVLGVLLLLDHVGKGRYQGPYYDVATVVKGGTVTITPHKHVDEKSNFYMAYLYGTEEDAGVLATDYGDKKIVFDDLVSGKKYFVEVVECERQGGQIRKLYSKRNEQGASLSIDEQNKLVCTDGLHKQVEKDSVVSVMTDVFFEFANARSSRGEERTERADVIEVTPLGFDEKIYTDEKSVGDMIEQKAMEYEEGEFSFYYHEDDQQERFTAGRLLVDNEISGVATSWVATSQKNKYGQCTDFCGKIYTRYDYEMQYEYNKAEQKRYLIKVNDLTGKLKGAADRKIRTLDSYFMNNTRYDYSLTKFDPYDLLIDGTAVCDGYARAAYLLLNKAGVKCEYIFGDGFNGVNWESHAWNIVEIDGKWYNCDFTWDSSLGSQEYLMKGSQNSRFSSAHVPDKIYENKAWQQAHPMAAKDL